MRVISGDKRGMPLKTLPGEDTRPTLDRVKEGMFSAVQFTLPGAQVLDLFAGSGQLGLEALSRGAAACTFVDASAQAAAVVRLNAERAGLLAQCVIRRQQAEAFLAAAGQAFDLVLIDPPYRSGFFPELLAQVARVCAPRANVLCESETEAVFPEQICGLALQKQYHYGSVMVSRYVKIGETPE